MPSIIKVDQIQSDTGNVAISGNVSSSLRVSNTSFPLIVRSGQTNQITIFDTRSSTGVGTMIGANQDGNTYYDSNYSGTATAGGHIWRSGGNDILTLGATGLLTTTAGIKFPGTQVSSADANTLDDYEEGTFTPAFFSDGDNVQITFSVAARYVKIGRYVWFCALCTRNQSSVTSGALYITGLPFAPATSNPTISLGGLSWFDNGGVTTDYLAATYVEASGSRIFFTQLTNPTQQQSARYVQAQNLSNNRPLYMTGSYMSDA